MKEIIPKQFSSSVPSEQSLTELQRASIGTQLPSLHSISLYAHNLGGLPLETIK